MADNNNNTPGKPLTRRGQLEHILKKLDREQLDAFIIQTSLRDQDWLDTILIHFADLLGDELPQEAKYTQTLHTLIDKYLDANGYINDRSANQLAGALEKLLESARKATTPPRDTIDLCMATIGIMPRLGERMDDTDGHIYRLMRITCSVLWECFSVLSAERQQEVFDRLLSEYAKPVYLDLDLDSFILTLLKDWAKDNKNWQTACLHQQELLLKSAGNDKWRKNYLLEQTNQLLGEWRKERL